MHILRVPLKCYARARPPSRVSTMYIVREGWSFISVPYAAGTN